MNRKGLWHCFVAVIFSNEPFTWDMIDKKLIGGDQCEMGSRKAWFGGIMNGLNAFFVNLKNCKCLKNNCQKQFELSLD